MGNQVKICGINSAEVADATVRFGADFSGLNFIERSPRYVTLEAGRALAERMRGRTRVVALLCDASDEQIAAVVQSVRPDMLQLHGNEAVARVGAIASAFGLPVIKAIAVAEAADLAKVRAYEDAADTLLFDAKAPSGASRSGGHGVAFDWQLLRGQRFAKPWLLAGGLDPQNVQRAIRAAEAPGVDTSSGVETAPGVKSPELIRAFIEAARNAQFATEQQS
jgi:phosphoribosylanthranilate isomerase